MVVGHEARGMNQGGLEAAAAEEEEGDDTQQVVEVVDTQQAVEEGWEGVEEYGARDEYDDYDEVIYPRRHRASRVHGEGGH